MKPANGWHARTILCTLTLCLLAFNSSLNVQAQAIQPSAKVDQLMRESGYRYKSLGEGVWVIDRTGTSLPKFQILIASGPGYVVFGVIIAEKKNMNVTSEMMFKLMKLNHALDYVKIGFDNDDDLFVRSEIKTRLLDVQEFKEGIERLSSDVDQIYVTIKPFLIAP